MRHLDDEAIKLLEARDAETRAYFAAHLADACEQCETYLEKVEGPGLLGAMADAALASRTSDQNAALDEVGFRRLRLRRTTWQRRAITFGSMAAALVAIASVSVILTQEGHDSGVDAPGIKGPAAALTLELEAMYQAQGELKRVGRGESVPSSGALILRYYATDRGGAWLFAVRGHQVEALGQFQLEPGRHPLELSEGQVASLPLEGEAGGLALVLVGAVGRFPTLDEARRGLENGGSVGLAKTRLELRIVPSGR